MSAFAAVLLTLTTTMQADVPKDLLTVAEHTNYTSTATSDDVLALIDRIKANSEILRTGVMGTTHEGRAIPLMFLANPPVGSVAEAVAASKQRSAPINFIMANIHAGEIEGKEACLMFARELALNPQHELLENLIFIIAPNYNADGNDRFDDVAVNRPGQDGPAKVGIRRNAQGLDLNRDYIKLEAPETRALVKFLHECNPTLTIDCHTTNGSLHRYILTYDTPLNPSSHPMTASLLRNELLPAVTKRVRETTGYEMFYYGNFNTEHTVWATYSALPRFGANYQGLRGQMSILSEAYTYAPYKDRVQGTLALIRESAAYLHDHAPQYLAAQAQIASDVKHAGTSLQPDDVVGIRHAPAAFPELVAIKGFEGSSGGEGGALANLDKMKGQPTDYYVVHLGRFEATRCVSRPCGYIVPGDLEAVIANLRAHGIEMTPCNPGDGGAGAPPEMMVNIYTIDSITRSKREFEGHHLVNVEATSRVEMRTPPRGSIFISTAQPLGNLIVYLLEPESEDGLVAWNFFDDVLHEGAEFPIWRVAQTFPREQRRDHKDFSFGATND